MSKHAANLFNYAVRHVTPTDVAAYAPQDPGYLNYVRAFSEIVESRKLPAPNNFDISETIGLTRWWNADAEEDPIRFRRFRTLANAVGLALSVAGQGENTAAGNYHAISLLDDTHHLGDAHQLSLLPGALEELHEFEAQQRTGEAPLVLLGILLARVQLGADIAECSKLAEQIMAEEAAHFNRASGEFLWGNTNFDSLHSTWKQHVERLLQPATPSLKLLREALLAESGNT